MNKLVIIYCKPCGYLKRAERVSELLKQKFNLNAELVPGKGGIFEIKVGEKIVSKRTRAGFPTEDEILTLVAEYIK